MNRGRTARAFEKAPPPRSFPNDKSAPAARKKTLCFSLPRIKAERQIFFRRPSHRLPPPGPHFHGCKREKRFRGAPETTFFADHPSVGKSRRVRRKGRTCNFRDQIPESTRCYSTSPALLAQFTRNVISFDDFARKTGSGRCGGG